MNTLLLKNNEHDIKTAGDILSHGGIVAIPTETVYGLAANALDNSAVLKVFAAKGRPADNPLIVHITQFSQLDALVSEIPPFAYALAEAFWPGPLTMIMKKSSIIPDAVSAGLDTVAVRMPSHPVARAVIDAAGVPLAAPSANLSGKPSPVTAQHCIDDLTGRADAIIDGGPCAVGVESTVITLVTDPPRLLRPGGVTLQQLRDVLGDVAVDDAVLGQVAPGAKVSSPGMKYKHYSPDAEVYIVKGPIGNFRKLMETKSKTDTAALVFEGEQSDMPVRAFVLGDENDGFSQAKNLFALLRQCDSLHIKEIYVRAPGTDGAGLAVCNRLLRAAAFRIIEV
jgi:L-threonylcarbamoyladenylate synthase